MPRDRGEGEERQEQKAAAASHLSGPEFSHIIAGTSETFYLVVSGEVPFLRYLVGYMLPTLGGNTLGGVSLVAALNHAQVTAGKKKGL